MPFVGNADLFPTFPTTCVYHFSPSACLHLVPKAVVVLPFLNGGLEGHLHSSVLL